MNSIKKIAFVGGAMIAASVLLVSATKDNGGDKNKKYQIIHQADGEMVTYDTVVPMTSSYTPEQFLSDKGISSENVEIVKIPSFSDMNIEGKGMKTIVREVEIDGDHKSEDVEIRVEMDEDGNMTTKKTVNGVEVEMTEEELEKIKSHHGDHGKMIKMRMDGGKMDGKEERVEIKVEMDEDGNKTIKKIVNGEEVEMTEEELEDMEIHHGKHENRIKIRMDGDENGAKEERVEIRVEMDDKGNKTITKTVNGEEVEMTEEELDNLQIMESMNGDDINVFVTDGLSDELDEEIKIEIEKMMEEGDKDVKVIKKRIEINSDDENSFEFESDNGSERIMVMSSDDEEDFTVVLVTENYDESTAGETKMMFKESNEDTDVYPNPNDGTFKIRYESDENLKTTITVNDANGKEVYKEKLGKFSGTYEKELDLKKFGSGMYTVTIENGNDEEVHKVMIK